MQQNRTVRIASPPGQLPIRVNYRASAVVFVFQAIAGALCFLGAGVMATTDFGPIPEDYEAMIRYGPLVLVIIGLGMLRRPVIDLFNSAQAVITRDEVRFTQSRMGRKASWSEPLAAYEGVRWRKVFLRRSSDAGGGKASAHVIELAHPDAGRTVELHVTVTRGGGPRKQWEELARLLGLPAIDAREEEIRIRAPEDVDTSIADLARAGKLDINWDSRTPPEKISVQHGGEPENPAEQEIRLTLKEQPFPRVLVYTLAPALGVLGIWTLANDRALVAAMLFGFAALTVWAVRSGEKTPAQLTLTRKDLTYESSSGEAPVHISLSAIEAVKVMQGSVFVETDEGEQKIASNLPDEALAYVRDFVEAAVAKA